MSEDEDQRSEVMKKMVRIGKIEEQDYWRRDDLRARTPDERVAMLVQLQADYSVGINQPLVRVAHVKRLRNG